MLQGWLCVCCCDDTTDTSKCLFFILLNKVMLLVLTLNFVRVNYVCGDLLSSPHKHTAVTLETTRDNINLLLLPGEQKPGTTQ